MYNSTRVVWHRTDGDGVYDNLISIDLVTTNIIEGGSASIHILCILGRRHDDDLVSSSRRDEMWLVR